MHSHEHYLPLTFHRGEILIHLSRSLRVPSAETYNCTMRGIENNGITYGHLFHIKHSPKQAPLVRDCLGTTRGFTCSAAGNSGTAT